MQALLCCDRYGWSIRDLVNGNIDLRNDYFSGFCVAHYSDTEAITAVSVLKCCITHYAEKCFLSRDELCNVLCSSDMLVLFWLRCFKYLRTR